MFIESGSARNQVDFPAFVVSASKFIRSESVCLKKEVEKYNANDFVDSNSAAVSNHSEDNTTRRSEFEGSSWTLESEWFPFQQLSAPEYDQKDLS